MLNMKKHLLLAWMMLCAFTLQAKTYLVSVGIADYPGTEHDLRISDNDAKTIAKVFSVAKQAAVSILINEQATQSALLSTIS